MFLTHINFEVPVLNTFSNPLILIIMGMNVGVAMKRAQNMNVGVAMKRAQNMNVGVAMKRAQNMNVGVAMKRA